MTKTAEKKRTFTYVDCIALQSLLGKAPMKDISDMRILKMLLSLKREVDQEVISQKQMQAKMFEEYNLKPDAKGYVDWSKHPEAKAITAKMTEMDGITVDLKTTHFMSEADFFAIAKAFELNAVDYLEQILMKAPIPAMEVAE